MAGTMKTSPMAEDVQPPPTPPGGDELEEVQAQSEAAPSAAAPSPTVQELLSKSKDMMKTYEQRRADMQQELNKQSKKEYEYDEEKLKPINIKDLKMPTEDDNDPKEFMEWHTRFPT